jgi:hypothetical protein
VREKLIRKPKSGLSEARKFDSTLNFFSVTRSSVMFYHQLCPSIPLFLLFNSCPLPNKRSKKINNIYLLENRWSCSVPLPKSSRKWLQKEPKILHQNTSLKIPEVFTFRTYNFIRVHRSFISNKTNINAMLLLFEKEVWDGTGISFRLLSII